MNAKAILQDGDITKEDEELIFNPYNTNNKDISESEIIEKIKKNKNINKFFEKKEINKTFFVKNRLVNFLIK